MQLSIGLVRYSQVSYKGINVPTSRVGVDLPLILERYAFKKRNQKTGDVGHRQNDKRHPNQSFPVLYTFSVQERLVSCFLIVFKFY